MCPVAVIYGNVISYNASGDLPVDTFAVRCFNNKKPLNDNSVSADK